MKVFFEEVKQFTLSADKQTVSIGTIGTNNWAIVNKGLKMNTGVYYAEAFIKQAMGLAIGIIEKKKPLTGGIGSTLSNTNNRSTSAYTFTGVTYIQDNTYRGLFNKNIPEGSTLGILIDTDNKIVKYRINNEAFMFNDYCKFNDWESAFIAISNGSTLKGASTTLNFGDTPFKYAMPTGAKPYNYEPSRYLIKQNSKYYSIKPEYYNAETKKFNSLNLVQAEPSYSEINNLGFYDASILAKPMTIGAESLRPIDVLDDSFRVELYKDS